MPSLPLNTRLWLSLIVLLLFTSAFAWPGSAGAAQAPEPAAFRVAEAAGLYFQGKGLTARAALIDELKAQAGAGPAAQATVLGTLLDICVHMQAGPCLVEYAPLYVKALEQAPPPDARARRELARTAAYYLDYARYLVGGQAVLATILEDPVWKQENAFNPDLYLRRQALAADVWVALGQPLRAAASLDRSLSLIASLENPQDARMSVAWALADAIAGLLQTGQVERAYGAYRSSGSFILQTLPPLSLDAARFRLTEADLLEQIGDLAGASIASQAAVTALERIELDPELKLWLQGNALTLHAVLAVLKGDMAVAEAAMARHPYADRYGRNGGKPGSYEEVTYLAARALVAAAAGRPDPIAAGALGRRPDFTVAADLGDRLELYRTAGMALAQSPGPNRNSGLQAVGRRLALTAGVKEGLPFGAWYRPSLIDQLLVGLSLGRSETAGNQEAMATAFALFQLDARRGPSFDADVAALLGQARTAAERRSIHEGLRLYARRNRLERAELQRVARRAAGSPGSSPLRHDVRLRGAFRDSAVRIAALPRGAAASGANLVPLQALQGVLARDEAALAVAAAPGGLAYLCVRRDTVQRAFAPADATKISLDSRVVQNALTANYAPSETLDAQFPAEAATRLYDTLIRPFETCLKPGDHILWLPSRPLTAVPLAALLEQVPPRSGDGYDLSAAAWLAKRHSVSYPGSAAALLAARRGARPPPADFDFLGVGDPTLVGPTAAGEDRQRLALNGVSGALASLAPLPETRAELEQSAAGFRSVRLLTGEAATERSFRGQMLGAYRYLSFATHGLLREELPGLPEPALAFTPVSSKEGTDDGLLTASEIADLRLSARFVALSACNTADFDLTQMSADLPALASAFAVAGVPATLATLWSVDSETSRRVVAGVFARLRDGTADPARALAAAQRAFLSAPPSRAYLHPRFWAPFVVLGDGGPADAPPAPIRLIDAAALSESEGGEVLAVARSDQGVAARFIGAADARGVHSAGTVVVSNAGAESWRVETRAFGAGRPVFEIAGRLIVGGYRSDGAGRMQPSLEALDPATGAAVAAWTGETALGLDYALAGSSPVDDGSFLFATLGVDRRARQTPSRIEVFTASADLRPRWLFGLSVPDGVDTAVVAPVGQMVLVAYSRRYGPAPVPAGEDDFDWSACGQPTTWIELRDRAGALRASTAAPGLVVSSGQEQAGRVLLGGSRTDGCAAGPRAVLIGMDDALHIRSEVEVSPTGEVRAITPDGRLLLVQAESVFDLRPADAPASGYDRNDLRRIRSGEIVSLGRDGRPSARKTLDSGFDLFATALDAGAPGQVIVGGTLGDRAALFRLTAGD